MVALADLDREDGTFHKPGTQGVFHLGFERETFKKLLEENGFGEVAFTTAHTVVKEDGKAYPIFLATAILL